MILQEDEYKLQDNGIWISKEALHRLKERFHALAEFPESDFGHFYLGKEQLLMELLTLFERK